MTSSDRDAPVAAPAPRAWRPSPRRRAHARQPERTARDLSARPTCPRSTAPSPTASDSTRRSSSPPARRCSSASTWIGCVRGSTSSRSSCRGIGRPSPTGSSSSRRVGGVADGGCRVLVTGGAAWGGPSILIRNDVRELPARPLHVITYRGIRVSGALKAMTFLQSHLAQRAAAAAGADDAIFVDDEGRMFEGATSNIFLARGGGLVTTRPRAPSCPASCAPPSSASPKPAASRWSRPTGAWPTCAPTTPCSSRAVCAASWRSARSTTASCASTRHARPAAGARRRAEQAAAAAFRATYL